MDESTRKQAILGWTWTPRHGAELRRLREQSGRTLKWCLEHVGKSRQAWNTWEQGTATPSRSDLTIIERDIFDVESGYFERFSLSPHPSPIPPPTQLPGTAPADAAIRALTDEVRNLRQLLLELAEQRVTLKKEKTHG